MRCYANARAAVVRTNADGWVRSSASACRAAGPRSLASARTTAMVAGTFLPGSRRQCCRAPATMESSGSVETSDASPAAAPARTSGSGSCVRLTSTPVSCGRFRRRTISAAQYRWSERPESRSSSIRVLQVGSGGLSATARLAASPTRSRSSSNTDTGCGVVRSAMLIASGLSCALVSLGSCAAREARVCSAPRLSWMATSACVSRSSNGVHLAASGCQAFRASNKSG